MYHCNQPQGMWNSLATKHALYQETGPSMLCLMRYTHLLPMTFKWLCLGTRVQVSFAITVVNSSEMVDFHSRILRAWVRQEDSIGSGTGNLDAVLICFGLKFPFLERVIMRWLLHQQDNYCLLVQCVQIAITGWRFVDIWIRRIHGICFRWIFMIWISCWSGILN